MTLYLEAHVQKRIRISHFQNKEVTLKLRSLVCKLGTFKSTPLLRVVVWTPRAGTYKAFIKMKEEEKLQSFSSLHSDLFAFLPPKKHIFLF